LSAQAQLVTMTAANISCGGQPLPAGIICFAATGGESTGYRIGSTGQAGGTICRDVGNGAILTTLNGTVIGPMMLADTQLSAPENMCFAATVRDPAGNYCIGAPGARPSGYSCVQPTANNSWCASGTCDFDNYVPNLPAGTLGESAAFFTVGNLTVTGTCTGCSNGSIDWGDILGTLSNQTDLQNALNLKLNTALLDAVNGVAPLDANALLPAANAPAAPAGTVLIGQGPNSPAVFADPLVQGTQAPGSGTQPNPVLCGVWDGSNNVLRSCAGESHGYIYVVFPTTQTVDVGNFPASVAVTGTFWQATQPVSIASMPTTPVTGTSWQATQPVSSLQLPAALDGNGFLKSHEQGTANVSVQNSSIAVTAASLPLPAGAATAGNQAAPGTAGSPSAAVVSVQGVSGGTPLPVSGTLATTPPANASTNLSQYGGVGVGQSNPVYVYPTDGTHNMPMGDSSARSIHETVDNFPATQPVSIASMPTTPVSSSQLPAALDSSGFLETHEQGTANVSVQNWPSSFWQATQPVSTADGQQVTLGAKADAKSSATDTTAISIMQVLKELSYLLQNPLAVTGSFYQTTQPVSLASLPALASGSNTVGKVDVLGNAGAAFDQAPGSAAPANAVQIAGTDGTNTVVPWIDWCQRGPHTTYSVSLTANTQIITGTSGEKIHICFANLVAAAATNVAIVEGTGTTCGTSTVAFPGTSGGATAATGWNFSANGGIVIGNGGFAVANEAVAADNVCILVSAANQVSGAISYVVY
jgi:hypothetical protein